jgi:hypothetical protein
VAERDRPDDDLEFEFFDDLDEDRTVENGPQAPQPKPTKRGPGGPGGPPPARPRSPGGGTPIVRLAALIGAVIVIGVLIIVGVTSCRGDKSQGDYEEYFQAAASLTRTSDDIGQQFTQLLAQPGLTLDDLQSQLGGLAEQQSQVATGAAALSPPTTLIGEQESLVEAMELRRDGLRGMADAVSTIQPSTDPGEAGVLLADQGARLTAGDVVYADLFKRDSQAVLKEEGVSGIQIADSVFLTDPELVTQDSLAGMVERINQGGGEATGKHGNGIVRVVVQPDGQELSGDAENEIVVTDDFAIEVVVENSGDFQETKVQVTLTIQGDPQIKKSTKIDLINPGETAVARFTDFVDLPYTTLTTLKVAVKPVEGEENTANNSADFQVIFTLA